MIKRHNFDLPDNYQSYHAEIEADPSIIGEFHVNKYKLCSSTHGINLCYLVQLGITGRQSFVDKPIYF